MKPGRQADVPVARVYDGPIEATEHTEFNGTASLVFHTITALMPEVLEINYGKVLTHESK